MTDTEKGLTKCYFSLLSVPIKFKSHNDLDLKKKGVIDIIKEMLDVRTRDKTHQSIVSEC